MTKIYNGLRFTIPDLHDLLPKLTEFRTEAEELATSGLHAVVAHMMVKEIDTAVIDGKKFERDFYDILTDIETRQKKSKLEGNRDPAVDYDFDLMLLPFQGQMYGIMYCEQRPFQKLLLAQPFVEEYAYWNNTDRPDEVTDEEWEERERVWAGIMSADKLSRPSRCGVSFTMEMTYFHPSLADVLPHVPTRAERARSQAERVLMNNLWAERIRDRPDGTTISKTIMLLQEVKAPENAERLAQIEESAFEMLPEISGSWVVSNFM